MNSPYRNRYVGAGEKICAMLTAHPEGMQVVDVMGALRADGFPTIDKQAVANLLSRMQVLGHTRNLGRGTGLWGIGTTPWGKKKRVYTKRRPVSMGNGATPPVEKYTDESIDMAIQNLRVAIADFDKVVAFVLQQRAENDAKADKVAKALAALA